MQQSIDSVESLFKYLPLHALLKALYNNERVLLFNLKTGRVINQILKGSTIGYIINGKFKSLHQLKSELELIPKEKTPF